MALMSTSRLVLRKSVRSCSSGASWSNLTPLPRTVFPRIDYYLKNLFVTHALIRPYFDHEFSTKDFLSGAKSAVDFVSRHLADGNLEGLEQSRVLSAKCLDELRTSLANFTLAQRSALRIAAEDILFNFIYNMDIAVRTQPKSGVHDRDRTVLDQLEVSYVGHAIPNMGQLYEQDKSSVYSSTSARQMSSRIVVLNYNFIKDSVNGMDSWTISSLNHFHLHNIK